MGPCLIYSEESYDPTRKGYRLKEESRLRHSPWVCLSRCGTPQMGPVGSSAMFKAPRYLGIKGSSFSTVPRSREAAKPVSQSEATRSTFSCIRQPHLWVRDGLAVPCGCCPNGKPRFPQSPNITSGFWSWKVHVGGSMSVADARLGSCRAQTSQRRKIP